MPPAAPAPIASSLLRRPGCWIAFLAGIPVLCGGVYLAENIFGVRALEQAKANLAAAGWSTDPISFHRPLPPDEENFGALPILTGIGLGLADDSRLDSVNRVAEWLNEMTETGLTLQEPHATAPTNWEDVHQLLTHDELWPWPASESGDPADALAEAVEQELATATAELRLALDRPHAVFKPAYFDTSARDLFEGSPRRSFGLPFHFAKAYHLRASLAISRGEGQRVLESCRILLRLASAVETESPLLPMLIATGLRQRVVNIVWAATQAQSLTAADYRQLSQMLHSTRPLESLPRVLHAEVVYSQIIHEWLRTDKAAYLAVIRDPYDPSRPMPTAWKLLASLIPTGWFDANQATSLRLSHSLLERLRNPAIPDRYRLEPWLTGELSKHNTFPFHGLTMQSLDILAFSIERVASVDVVCRLAEAACALEGYFSDHRNFPASLNELVPAYLPAMPADLDAQPIRFAPDTLARYRLWSVGSDGMDNGGLEKPSASSSTAWRWTASEGDWVWSNTY